MSDITQQVGTKAAASSTILVVEPDILVRMVVADYLRGCGYAVVEGVNADDALTILRAKIPVHILLTEVRLRGSADGFGLAQHVRRHFPGIDVILTSNADSVANKAKDICDDGLSQKPYHPHEIVRRINLLREQRHVTHSDAFRNL